jgi:hypothetical protein
VLFDKQLAVAVVAPEEEKSGALYYFTSYGHLPIWASDAIKQLSKRRAKAVCVTPRRIVRFEGSLSGAPHVTELGRALGCGEAIDFAERFSPDRAFATRPIRVQARLNEGGACFCVSALAALSAAFPATHRILSDESVGEERLSDIEGTSEKGIKVSGGSAPIPPRLRRASTPVELSVQCLAHARGALRAAVA